MSTLSRDQPRRSDRAADRAGRARSRSRKATSGASRRASGRTRRRRLRDAFLAGRKHGDRTFLVYNDERASFEGFARASLARRRRIAAARRAQGRPRRHRDAQPAGMAGRVLRRDPRRRDRDAAQRLGNRAGAGIRPGRLRRESRASSIASGWSGCSSICTNCPALARVFVSRESRGGRASPGAQARGSDRRDQRLGQAARPRRCPRSNWRPTTTRRSSIPPAPPASRKARSARIAIPARRSSRGAFGFALAFLRRGEPHAGRRPRTRRSARCCSRCRCFHTTGCQSTLIPALAQGGKIVHDAQMGRRAGAEADRARAHQLGRRRADHRLAIDRASRPRQIRSLLARQLRLWRRAGAGRTGATHQDVAVRRRSPVPPGA